MKKVSLTTIDRILFLTLSLFFVSIFIGCSGGGGDLPPKYDEANMHMVSSLKYANDFMQWMNDMKDPADASVQEWNEALRLLELSIKEAKLVSPEFLQNAHNDLPEMWKGFYIPGNELIYAYYFQGINSPQSVQSPSSPAGRAQLNSFMEGRNLDDMWGNWYNKNRDEIRAGIRKMSK